MKRSLHRRETYLRTLSTYMDTDLIKIITGIRRCGKSSLLKLMVQDLRENGIPEDQILEMNFESHTFSGMNAEGLYRYVASHEVKDKRMYLFLDELQRVENWPEAINSFQVDFDCDIYITGSNAYLLSGEFSTYLSGRYVEIEMLPLSFSEFIRFQGYVREMYTTPSGEEKSRIRRKSDNEVFTPLDILNTYLRYGGMPAISSIKISQEHVLTLLDGIYSTVVLKDIFERDERRRPAVRQITDPFLLKKIVLFLADNIGNPTSLHSIGKMIAAEGDVDEGKRKNHPAVNTVKAYVGALLDSFVFYEVKRFDIKGKEHLKTQGKYYIVDPGLRNFLLGFTGRDVGRVLENVVFLELRRRGYDVAVGKMGSLEVDFVARRGEEVLYIQVTQSMVEESTRERELAPLRKIQNGYPKLIISGTPVLSGTEDGFSVKEVSEWLLEEE
ncbi:MAG: ATP-binding protein [Sphaerochaetaceae bacterium]|nr:ATP-binding protein [Sphaerochaetaceae bacterium]